jgi:hypothetical protein
MDGKKFLSSRGEMHQSIEKIRDAIERICSGLKWVNGGCRDYDHNTEGVIAELSSTA